MLSRVKISTAIYIIALILLVGWLAKSYLDLENIKTRVKSLTQEVIDQADESALDNLKVKQAEKYRSAMNGIFINAEDVSATYPVAIVIDNFVKARAQAGLDKAAIVFEAAAEGGITRFLAIFELLDGIQRIGSIRSARPYFLDWSEEFGKPVFLHVGGSADALQGINRRNVINLDEFYWRYDYYQRVSDRAAPHNVYTTPELLDKIKKKYSLTSGDYKSWQFKEDAKFDQRGEVEIDSIDFSKANYDYEYGYTVSWKYDKVANNYVRWQGGEAHKTENDVIIRAKNVAIIYTDEEVVDNIGRLKIRTLGEGKAQVFQGGHVIEGVWRKDDVVSRTRFYDGDGDEIDFNAGVIWVEVVPVGNGVVISL